MKSAHHLFSETTLADWLERFRSSPDAGERYRAVQAIGALATPEEAISVLTSGLEDVDSSIRAGVGRWLARQARKSPRSGRDDEWRAIAAHWTTLLGDDDPDVRFEAARGLVALDAACLEVVRVLAELLADDETQPAMLAAILDAIIGVSRTTTAPVADWSRFLQHEQSGVREAAARAVAHWEIGSAAFAREILPLLDDEDPFVREEAAKALGTMGVAAPEILSALEAATQDDDEIVAAAARASLQQLPGRSA